MIKKKFKFDIPYLLKGDMARDERGSVGFVNEFKFPKVKRFYVVSNQRVGMIRAWHGHKREGKYVFAISGKALVGAVRVDDWINPSKEAKVYNFLLSSEEPAVLCIPKGYVNGFRSLTSNAKLMFFSTRTLIQSKKDDIRFDPEYWNIRD